MKRREKKAWRILQTTTSPTTTTTNYYCEECEENGKIEAESLKLIYKYTESGAMPMPMY